MLGDVLGKDNARYFSEEMGYIISQVRQIIDKELRPWQSEFFSSLKPPQMNWKHIEQRIITNCLYYRANYFIICGIIMGLQLLFDPIEICILVIVIMIDVYLLLILRKPVRLGDLILSQTQKQIVVGIVSIVFLILTGVITAITWTCLYCTIVTGLHMVFRPRSVTSKTSNGYDEPKISGYSGWFSGDSTIPSTSYESGDLENSSYSGNNINMRKRGGNVSIPTRSPSMGGGMRKSE